MLLNPKKVLWFNTLEVWFPDRIFNDKRYDKIKFKCYNKIKNKNLIETRRHSLIIDLSKPLEKIWNDFEKRNRNSINKAKKLGIKIKKSNNFRIFYDFYRPNIEKKKSYIYPLSFLKRGLLFVAKYKDEIVSGSVFLMDKDEKTIVQIVNATKKRIHGVNNLLLWHVIKWSKRNELKIFDLGGISLTEDKNDPKYWISFFKKSFGGKIVPIYEYEIFNSKIYKVLRKINRIKIIQSIL